MIEDETENTMKELLIKHRTSFFKWNEIDTLYIRKGIDSVAFSEDKETFTVVYYEKFVGWVSREFNVDEVQGWLDLYEGSERNLS